MAKEIVEKIKQVKKTPIEKLTSHAVKHIGAWYEKAGVDSEEFSKGLKKYLRTKK